MRGYRKMAAVCAALVMPTLASAHTGNAAAGFLDGLLHPVFGVDHFLAMLSVGIVSAQLGGRRIYEVPALFVLSMIGGAIVGIYGAQWPFTEAGIALSVITLGAAIALARKSSNSVLIMVVVAFFGSLHGHAHGLEMPGSVDPVYYAGGFVVSTATIHVVGVLIGHVLCAKDHGTALLHHMGSFTAGIGLMIFVNTFSGS
jgi:urease accessory protein